MAFPRCASALLIALALLTASPGVTSEGPASASAVRAFPGGDLEGAGVFEAALAARAPAGELIVMCVGDTQDPRRVVKDPALKTLSVDFAVNLVRNLAGVGVEHYFMLTSSEALCRRLQTDYGVEGCVWSSLWADHPGQVEWAVKADEMFLMWAKQWHYVARALRTGLNVMRLDGDVFFGENPYPLLKGPYLGRFNMISQNDIFQAFTRPTCVRHEQAAPIQAGFAENHHDREFVEAPAGADLPPCLLAKLRPELNIGMLYVQNASPDGAAVEIIETVVSRIVELLGKPALRDKPGKILKEQLLDQPLFRHEASTRVREGVWFTSKGDLVPFYTDGDCPHREDRCNEISRMRARANVRYARIATKAEDGDRYELIAGAPDWLFGKACVKQINGASARLKEYRPAASANAAREGSDRRLLSKGRQSERRLLSNLFGNLFGGKKENEGEPRLSCDDDGYAHAPVMPFPSAQGHAMVGVHMVYSMARKRAGVMGTFGMWDVCKTSEKAVYFANGTRGCVDAVNGKVPAERGCFEEPSADDGGAAADRGLLASHTLFRDFPDDSKILLCGDGAVPGCKSCCATLPEINKIRHEDFEMVQNMPDGSRQAYQKNEVNAQLSRLPGCGVEQNAAWNDYWN